MTDREVLQMYVSLVPFLGEMCGPGTEVIIHDTSNPEHSLIAICNGISGRVIGNPITDLARDLAERGDYKEKDYIANYTGHTKSGDFLSGTFYIKNEGRLIGLLCINKDLSAVQELQLALNALSERFNLKTPSESDYTEDLSNPIHSMIHNHISEVIGRAGIPPARMSPEEKTDAVQRLKEDGILSMKGAVAETADQLGVSIPTIYRYMSKFR